MSSKPRERNLYVGLMSGTSMDAIDAAVVDFGTWPPRLLGTHSIPQPPDLRGPLADIIRADSAPLSLLGQLDIRLGRLFADAALGAIGAAGADRNEVAAIGSHGQTIWHQPQGAAPFTWQLGDPNTIAECTALPVVADFRRRDMAAGGQGAPLVPAFHAALFGAEEPRVAVNLGGIGNITVLPGSGGGSVFGFDTGPANGLMDAWIGKLKGESYDLDGRWARTGRVDGKLLDRMLADPYFRLPPPKSTGREYFHLGWVESLLAGSEAPEDVQATLCELTARTVADAILQHAPSSRQVILCGGGSYNGLLRERLGHHLAPMTITDANAFGIPPQWIEAAAFAWLARETLAGRAGNLPAVTGARHPVVLGAVYAGPLQP